MGAKDIFNNDFVGPFHITIIWNGSDSIKHSFLQKKSVKSNNFSSKRFFVHKGRINSRKCIATKIKKPGERERFAPTHSRAVKTWLRNANESSTKKEGELEWVNEGGGDFKGS